MKINLLGVGVGQGLHFVWLEITGKCQLTCSHCYAGSSPAGTHGTMTAGDWARVIEEAAGLGVVEVQFIGGEPTTHPALPALVGHALGCGLAVEVFSNLYTVTASMWEVLSQPGVRLATSFYSDQAGEHDQITARSGSYARTRANIAEALRRQIPLRAGVIDVSAGQRAEQAVTLLQGMAVGEVRTDRLRQVGRGERDQLASVDQLCGRCAAGVLAVGPDGAVWPCVFSRWLPVGNVHTASLGQILAGGPVAEVRAMLDAAFSVPQVAPKKPCTPDDTPSCNPTCAPKCAPQCAPSSKPCRPASSPCHPQCGPACQPNCSPGCSPTCQPIACAPRGCWPAFR